MLSTYRLFLDRIKTFIGIKPITYRQAFNEWLDIEEGNQ